MSLGISTSCFYPLSTEDALRKVAECGAKVTEVFFNAPSEFQSAFLKELAAISAGEGMRIKSVHPFTSFAEGYILFSRYSRRFDCYRDFYKNYYAAASALGAQVVVLHGAKNPCDIPPELYAERLGLMIEDARSFGVTLAQENVIDHNIETPERAAELERALSGELRFVLDIKQSVLAGHTPFDFLRRFKGKICHIHISDHGDKGSCLLPGEGGFDFASFFSELKSSGYNGDCVIELYRSGFGDESELAQAFKRLEKIYNSQLKQ